MKGFISALLGAVLLLGFTACDNSQAVNSRSTDDNGSPAAITEVWNAPDNTFSVWFSEDDPENSADLNNDTQTIHIGKTADGKDIFGLLRLPLRGTWMADEISDARLFFKVKDGVTPSMIHVGFAAKSWGIAGMSRVIARMAVDDESVVPLEVKQEGDSWISVHVTNYIKEWLSGDRLNNGFALFGDTAGEVSMFVSDWAEDNADRPYLTVSGAVGPRASDYGKFGYTEMPLPGMNIDEGGNCMSYALRDRDMILIDDLGADFDLMNSIYSENGEDAVADYMNTLVKTYVEAHKEGLRISEFREIDGFEAVIDPETEYRIALRVGCKTDDGEVDLGGKRNFDYHFWAQLQDGQWAQKFPLDPSEIIPGTAPGLSPGKYSWNSAIQWSDWTHEYYTSKIIYYAVTKDAAEFTKHKG